MERLIRDVSLILIYIGIFGISAYITKVFNLANEMLYFTCLLMIGFLMYFYKYKNVK